jgi:hypothetical protein
MDWFDPTALPTMMPNMRRTVDAWLEFQRGGEFQLI